jgi:hypothetical protein
MHQLQHQGSLVLLLVLLLGLIRAMTTARVTVIPSRPAQPGPIWGEKPVLGYFVFTASLAERLPQAAGLSGTQFAAVEQIAQNEVEALQALEQESLPIIQDPDLSLREKRQRITEMKYNQRVQEVVRSSMEALKSTLGTPAYARLSHWVESQWRIERELHGSAARLSSPRTYRVYATRYDSRGAYTVALPDKCLKFANGGSHICDGDGYVAGAGYTVYMSYESGTAAVVGESGPWNVDDNFWATTADPTPRRMFTDLGLGMPEAQAAYFNGYNGGVDQFGREVTAPFGIDLARQVSIDIGLEPGKNDWIDVSFMWTEGWGSNSNPKPNDTDGTAQALPTLETIIPIRVSEANPDGSVIHEVKEGQTLWNIAAAYQVNLGEILRLNGLNEGSLIYPGQKLLIKAASLSPTPADTSTVEGATLTTEPSATPRPSWTPTPRKATPVAQVVPTLNITSSAIPSTPIDQALANDPLKQLEIDPFLKVIGGLALTGAALFLVGQLLSRKAS